MLWHAYVDETGDRGWKRRPVGLTPGTRAGSSEHFSMCAVVVPDGYQTTMLSRWDQVTVEIGRRPGDVVHWINVKSHGQRLHLATSLAAFDQMRLVGVVFSKWDVQNAAVDGVRQPEYLYHWVLRLLVERLSWFASRRGDQVHMTFAQVKGLDPARLNDYLNVLAGIETKIEWSGLHLPPRIDTPANRRMLQLADTANGALSAAFEWDDFGQVEPRYLEQLRPRFWAGPAGRLNGYGLKVAPYPHPRHQWVSRFCNGAL